MEIFLFICGSVLLAFAGLFDWMRRSEVEGIAVPPENFVFGHVFHLGGNFCKTFLKWKQVLGPVFQLRFFHVRYHRSLDHLRLKLILHSSNSVIVFNDIKTIARVCAKPEAAGRVHMGFYELMCKIMGEGVVGAEGPAWAEQRQFFLKSLKTFGVGQHETLRKLQDEMDDTLSKWIDKQGEPFMLEGCNTNFVFNALWSVIGSKRIEHSRISNLSHHMQIMSKLDTFGRKLAVISTRLAKKVSNSVDEKIQGFQALAEFAREAVAEHQENREPKEPRDVIDKMLDVMDMTTDPFSAYHEKNLKTGFALGDVIAATIDTTSRTLEWLMFHLARNPEKASKLHAEIYQVYGSKQDFWPQLSDRDTMPYTQACILEALRIGSVVPFGVPHKALEDFEFDGALIPRGTILIMNLYGVHYDPESWEQPEEFKPERFLSSKGKKVDPSAKSNVLAFGIGRRKCAGYSIAMDLMFLFVVNAYRNFLFEIVGNVSTCEGRFGIVNYPPPNIQMRAIPRINKN